jgi:transcriptional regulator with XRE-family HTH domain
VVDILTAVTETKPPATIPRGRTIPIYGKEYEWWTQAVRRQLKVAGIDQVELAEKLGVAPSDVSRCINRKKPTYDLLLAISDELKVAYPVILPTSEEEALALATEKRAFKRVAEAEKIKAGVPENLSEDQTDRVASEHAIRSSKQKAPKRPRQRQQHGPA